MTKPTILHIVGTRPNIIKLGPLHRAIDARGLHQRVLHSGQHFDPAMSESLFADFSLPAPDRNLNVGGASEASQFARVVDGVAQSIEDWQPGLVLVYGDVRSTLAAAIAANLCKVKVVHYESGLRIGHRGMPEELNRVCADVFSDLLLLTEPGATANLDRLGLSDLRTELVGNLMCDALRETLGDPDRQATLVRPRAKKHALITCHRAATVDDPANLRALIAILTIAGQRLPLLFPMHPRTRSRLEQHGLTESMRSVPNLSIVESLRYSEMAQALADAHVVISDSGGLVPECCYANVPHVYLRDGTEHGGAPVGKGIWLSGLDPARFTSALHEALRFDGVQACPPEWDGQSAQRIAAVLERELG